MNLNRLSILSIGTEQPPSVVIKDYAASLGADTSFYKSWDRACHARDDEQPSTMGSAALTKALAQSGVDAKKIRLVLFTGVSRDYVPSWSVATEIM
jgi:3-oxoacyl-[acyl-carrier-protein] synthase III